MSPDRVETLVNELESWFDKCESCVIAFSGGVDSSLVAFLARRFLGRDRCLAVIGNSESLKQRDLKGARVFAAQHDIPLEIVQTHELDDPDYRQNPKNRCFYCKTELFNRLEGVRRRLGFKFILGGENLDDHSDYRPGLEAAAQAGVRAPLAECEITKDELRAIARHFELECWEKPASPCMGSRIPYFSEITREKLDQVEAGESLLETLGFPVARVRHYGAVARIEVPAERVADLQQHRDELDQAFRAFGFEQLEIDPEGFVSGKMNRVL